MSRGGTGAPDAATGPGSLCGADVAALERYASALRAGLRPPREAFLADHPDLSGELARCLDVLDFIHSAAGTETRGGEPSPPADALPPGTVLGDYRLIREAGRGGMGVVYEAEQVSLARRVALKVLPFAAALDARHVQRFRIEAQAAAQLNHPHIVPVHAVGSDGGFHYYAMRFIEGRSLAAVIRDRQRPGVAPGPGAAARDPARAVAAIGLQAAEALEHAHSLGVLHRDIKPGNLLLDAAGGLWVADFGLARLRDDPGPTQTGDVLGTLRYMSAEQVLARRGVVDQRADVYSLGVTLYEALTLRPAFDGRDRSALLHQVLFDEPAPPRRIDPTIPRVLETVVLKAMAKEPSGRYPTAGDLAEDLRRFLDDAPVLARPQTVFDRGARWVRRHRTAVAAAASALLLTLAASSAVLWKEWGTTAEALQASERALTRESRAMDVVVAGAHALTMRAMESVTREGERGNPEDRPFLEQAQAFYEEVDRLTRDDPRRRDAAAKACFGVGLTRWLLGKPGFEDAFRRSIALYDRLIADGPTDFLKIQRLASLKYLGIAVGEARGLDQAEPYFRQLLDAERGLVEGVPSDPSLKTYLANDLTQWGEMLKAAGRPDDAERALREARELAPPESG